MCCGGRGGRGGCLRDVLWWLTCCLEGKKSEGVDASVWGIVSMVTSAGVIYRIDERRECWDNGQAIGMVDIRSTTTWQAWSCSTEPRYKPLSRYPSSDPS